MLHLGAAVIPPTIDASPRPPTPRLRDVTIAVRDIERDTDLDDRVDNATGDVIWTRDGKR